MDLPRLGRGGARVLLVVLAGIWLASCTDQQPAGPAAPTGPAARHDDEAVEQWRAAGTFSVPSTGGAGSYPLTSTGIKIEPGQRARISVSGGITLTYNDGYSDVCGIRSIPQVPGIDRPGHCGSGEPWDGQTAGPLGFPALDNAMWVQVWLQRPDGQMIRVGYGYDGAPFQPEITGPGTLYVSRIGFTEYFAYHGVYVWNISGTNAVSVELLKAPDDSLILECIGDKGRDQVTRGQGITCTAKATPAGAALEILSWKFEGGGTAVTPKEGDEHATTWVGKMVAGGTITVTGTVNSHSRTASASITVSPRDWSTKEVQMTAREVKPGEDSRMTALPAVISWASDLGYTKFWETEHPNDFRPDFAQQVDDAGPNRGLWYLGDDTEFRVYPLYILNHDAMSSGSPFQLAQEKNSGGASTGRPAGINYCEQMVISRLTPLVLAHELRHVEVYRASYQSGLAAMLPDVERATSTNASDVDAAYDAVFNRLDPQATKASLAIHQLQGNPNSVAPSDSEGPCALKNSAGGELLNKPGS